MADKGQACGLLNGQTLEDAVEGRMHNKSMRNVTEQDLTALQKRFAAEYIANGCKDATAALRATGYQTTDNKTLTKKAYKLKNSKAVQKYITNRLKERGAAADFSVDRVMLELKSVITSSMEDFIEIQGGKVVYRDWSEIDREKLKSIQSIKEDKYGISIKLHDKTAAIDRIAKIYGFDNVGKKVNLPDLPRLTSTENAMLYIEMVNEAVVCGQVTVEQGSQLVNIARDYLKAVEVHDIEDQLNELRELIDTRTRNQGHGINNYGSGEDGEE